MITLTENAKDYLSTTTKKNGKRFLRKLVKLLFSGKKGTKNLFFDHELSSLNTINKNHTLFLKKAFSINKFQNKKVKTETLNNILKKHKIYRIDFMNIDIEGNELDVLKTINFRKIDIKVICIEIVNYEFYSKKIKVNKVKKS